VAAASHLGLAAAIPGVAARKGQGATAGADISGDRPRLALAHGRGAVTARDCGHGGGKADRRRPGRLAVGDGQGCLPAARGRDTCSARTIWSSMPF